MISTSRLTPLMSKTFLGVAISASVFVLTACSAETDTPKPSASSIAGESTGILETSTGSYLFTPTTCAIFREDGFDDIEIQGPGTAPDGEKFYFEFSSTANAVTIELGVDRPFASSARKLRAGQHVSQKFPIDVSGSIISVTNLALVNEQGQSVDGNASLQIDCGA